MEALLALVVMTSIDHQPWRWLLGLTALPMLIVIVLFVVSHCNVCTNCIQIVIYNSCNIKCGVSLRDKQLWEKQTISIFGW